MKAIIVKHGGVDIEYIESSNRWRYELDGRERHADSLQNAKQAIDAPPKEKKKPFKKFQAFFKCHWQVKFETVTVTSFIDNGYGGFSNQAWITDSEGKRSKEPISKLIADIPKNHVLMSEYKVVAEESEKLRKKLDGIETKFVRVTIPEELKNKP